MPAERSLRQLRRALRAVPVIVAALALCASPGGGLREARAQTSSERAEELFRRGKASYEAGDLATACPTLAESDGVEPAIGTLGLLAACYEKQGKLASALRAYRETQARAQRARDPRESFARERADALEAQAPRLTVTSTGNERGLQVTCDDQPIAIGEAVLVDPGVHRVVAQAPGRVPVRLEVTLGAGERAQRTIEPLLSSTAAAAPAGAAQSGLAAAGAEPGSGQRTAALVAGGVGLAGLAVGAIFGVMAISKNDEKEELEATCGGGAAARPACDEGPDLHSAAMTRATVSTIGFAVGGVGAAAAVVLYATAPSGPRTESARRLQVLPAVGMRGGAVWVRAPF